MKTKMFITLFLLLAVQTITSTSTPLPPHIVFFLVDDLGWNDVSFHGSLQIPTPTIDNLASKGVRLNQYYVNPVCSPTRGSLMTGRSMMHTGIQTPYGAGDDASGLNLTYTLLPEQLKKNFNYTSYMIGKWHLGMKNTQYLPSTRGFDKYYGYYLGCTDYWKHYGDDGDHGEIAVELHQGGAGLGLVPGVDEALYNTSGKYSTLLYADIASKWIREHDQNQPMFLYLPFQGAHSANNKFVQAPPDIIARFDAIISNKTCGQWETPLTAGGGVGDMNNQCDKFAMRKTIAATVVAVDEAVATVVETLKEVGMYNNTLIIFSTDNGGPTDGTNNNMMSNFPLRSGKGETFEGGIRAVGFVHGAGLQSNVIGTVSNELIHVSDWYLTLLAAAASSKSSKSTKFTNKQPPPPLELQLKPGERPFIDGDGVSNWASIATGTPSARTEILIAAQAPGSKLQAQALRSGDWKLLRYPRLLYDMPGWYPPPGKQWNYTNFTVVCGGPPPLKVLDVCEKDWCLFNLKIDPCEFKNVAKTYPLIVQQLQDRLQTLSVTTVLTWINFSRKDVKSNPTHFGPTTRITPDPQSNGPHIYQGVWKPWLTKEEERETYPTAYSGPGYPP